MRLAIRNVLRQLLLHCCVLITITSNIACGAESILTANTSPVVISKGKYSDYYHISYTLTPDNTSLNLGDARPNTFENENGQFEVYLNKSQFPVAAPMCKHSIILRMPGTNPFGDQPEQSINEKKVLFKRIQTMTNTRSGSVEVIIELNPYVEKIRDNPLTLQLTQCNIFFRQAQNRYLDFLGEPKKISRPIGGTLNCQRCAPIISAPEPGDFSVHFFSFSEHSITSTDQSTASTW